MASSPSSREQIEYCKRYLRRKFAGDAAGLQALADEVFSSATQTVTITAVQFHGSVGSGQIQFDRTVLGVAIEAVLEELGVGAEPPGEAMADYADWSGHATGT